ncbi:Hypothetical protein PFR_JS13-2_192 [Propionibacterium freudenreichii]|uniref:6-carboxyhexanoate--CoA ligase n=1 Tax=Propionibacterium freudenreichii TaxID=1744 RepID=UPI000BC2C997|nr:6-carboxyhexanoate--CoA ligase [Propionibacterium freudenreichii]SBN59114.1 Hypothetical protein PFR_JS11_192 [Propionibacterium freudenreichii]SCQ47324.1 Hypothetical protein PFR_JS13-1_192 [Propionibacterium freudenreichii]SCQ50880.1 Hypothetical protein PFR_JS13-2_192 [Propionibacterium freudenreichii]
MPTQSQTGAGENRPDYFSVRMRASADHDGTTVHVSGAETLVREQAIGDCLTALLTRGMSHPREPADSVVFSVDRIPESALQLTTRLPTHVYECADAVAAYDYYRDRIAAFVADPDKVMRLLHNAPQMRGAMLISCATGERLEPDAMRGVRVSTFGVADDGADVSIYAYKQHHNEAVVLASKVAMHPDIVAELCISDDPDYTRGYVCADGVYTTVTNVKQVGDPHGGRVMLYSGEPDDVTACIEWLQHAPVLVEARS